MSIKIDKQYDEPWKVMKAASEGKRVVRKMIEESSDNYRPYDAPKWNWAVYDYAIIDDSQTELTEEWWEGFDWEFFKPYHGLTVWIGDALTFLPRHGVLPKDWDCKLAESPFYYWGGGECPVPGNVEVEVQRRNGYRDIERASKLKWDYLMLRNPEPNLAYQPHHMDIISFRLTGRVL